MKTLLRWVGATLVGALLLALLGVAAAAPASAATRQFVIVNDTRYTLTLTKVTEIDRYGCNGGDQFQPGGTQLEPGTVYRYEKTFYFGVSCKTELDFTFVDRYGELQTVFIDLSLSRHAELSAYVHHHPHIAVEYGQPGTVLLTTR